MEFELTPVQQTPYGCFPELKVGPRFMSLIITLVVARFTLSPLPSLQCFHAAYRASNSSKLLVIITKSFTDNICQGSAFTFSRRGFKSNNEQQMYLHILPQHQTCLRQCYSDHTVAAPINYYNSPYQPLSALIKHRHLVPRSLQ